MMFNFQMLSFCSFFESIKRTIPKGSSFSQLSIPNNSSILSVTADPSTQVDLSCPNRAQIVIPDNNNYVLRENCLITLNPGKGLTSVIILKNIYKQRCMKKNVLIKISQL